MEYVKIADLSSPGDIISKGTITLGEVDVDVDVFNFVEHEDSVISTQDICSPGNFHEKGNAATLQANIMDLPNRSLNGLGNSYVACL